MSDDEHDHDDEAQRHIASIFFGGLFQGDEEEMRQTRDRHQAESTDMKNRLFAALDSMTNEQLLMVRQMVLWGARNRHALSWFDGILSATLQMQRGVDFETGMTPEEALLDEASKAKPGTDDHSE